MKWFCRHGWEEVSRFYTFDSPSLTLRIWWVKVYCPKCRKTRTMKLWDFEEYLKIKEIDEKYRGV